MTFRHISTEIASERLFYVQLDDAQYVGSEYRHIRATVIRRAVPHKLRKDAPAIYDGTGVEVWNDDHIGNCSGYRVASYSSARKDAVYVDDMQLRGQIDIGHNPLNNGRPYGNKVNFKPFDVCKNSAKAIFGFFQKMENFKNRHGLNRSDKDFYVELNHLAQFLKITRVVFLKSGVRHASLSEANCYEEVDIAFAKGRIDAMLAPFYKE